MRLFAVVLPLHMLFLLEKFLLAAHQGKTAKQYDKVSWNKLKMIYGLL